VGAKKVWLDRKVQPFSLKGDCIVSFSFYMADSDYCDYLRKKDPCVPYTMEHKSVRPFVGIVFLVGAFQYYAPLASPKPKHLQMKNQIDFLKINRGVWGAINFNL